MEQHSQHHLFEDIEENFAFGTYGHSVTPCCQDSLAEALLCVYRQLKDFYEEDGLYEFVYYYGEIIYLDQGELDFGVYGDYTRKEIADYLQDYIEGVPTGAEE